MPDPPKDDADTIRAPAKVPSTRPSQVPPSSWGDKRFITLGFVILTALGSILTSYVQSRNAEKAGVTRADFGFDAVRSELDRQAKATADIAADVRAQREWLVAFLHAQQVSAPVVPSPAAPPVVVMAQPGGEAPSKRTLTPLARSLPPLPPVQAAPSPPTLPRSLDALVEK